MSITARQLHKTTQINTILQLIENGRRIALSSQSTINFTTSIEILQALESNAASNRVSISQVINDILKKHLADIKSNRRVHDRVEVDMIAVARSVEDQNNSEFLPGKISDLSIAGLKLVCDDVCIDSYDYVDKGKLVEVIFSVPQKEYPIYFTCEIKHIRKSEQIEVGCEFLNSTRENLSIVKETLASLQ